MSGRFLLALMAVVLVGFGLGASVIAFQGRASDNGSGAASSAVGQQMQAAGEQGLPDFQTGDRQGSFGIVENVSSSGFDLVAQNNRVRVKTSDETRVTKVSDIKLADLKVGDEVVAMVEQQSTGVLTALSIQVGERGAERGFGAGAMGQLAPGVWRGQDQGSGSGARPQRTPIAGTPGAGGLQGARGLMVAGFIEAIDGTSIAVKTQAGSTSKVTSNSATVVRKTVDSSRSGIEAGQAAMVAGERNDDGSLAATTVQIVPAAMLSAGR